MYYENYQVSRDLAWKVLLTEHITALPVMVGKLCKSMGISVVYYTPAPNDPSDGYTVAAGEKIVIHVAEGKPKERQRFTAAHELGHILLGHVGRYPLVNREPDPKDNPVEQAANVFASRLLAPACVLWALNARTPEEIATLCQISRQAAAFRAERMELLCHRGKFLTSPLEQAVYAQFEDFIQRKKQKL